VARPVADFPAEVLTEAAAGFRAGAASAFRARAPAAFLGGAAEEGFLADLRADAERVFAAWALVRAVGRVALRDADAGAAPFFADLRFAVLFVPTAAVVAPVRGRPPLLLFGDFPECD
jgi:hypothetical protein